MFKLLPYLKNYKKEVIIGPIFKLLEAIFELMVPLVMAKIIDIGVKNGDYNYVIKAGIALLVLGFLGLFCALVCQYSAAKASQGFGTDLRNDLFSHINSLSHSEIDIIGTSSLITRLTNDVNQLQLAVAMFIRLAFRAPFIIIGSAVMAMTLDLKLSIVFLFAIPLISLTLFWVMSKSIPFYSNIQKKLDKISLITEENLEGARVIRAFSKEENEKKRFIDASDDYTIASINVSKISALLNPLTSIIMNFAIVAILWYGGYRVNIGALTQGQIIAFVNYMTQISLTLVVFANLVVIFTKAFASGERVYEILEINSSITDKNTKISPVSNALKVEFKNVSFSYKGSNKNSLSNANIKVNTGETIGIIGGTGSGKSTLINLIPRFYEATEGEVLIDGVNVKDYNLNSLRDKIGIVPQKAALFSGTLRENMTLGNKNASDEEIKKAFDIAQASEFVSSLSKGLDTVILQGGKNLSGGQKQRLTIARALVKNPEILILDDSASALDFATDAKLRKAIKEETKNMTVFIISQRATSIKNADKIIVLDNGNIVGIGSHSELLKNCTVYKEICLSQLSSEEVEK
ncbi:MAG: ABC transporter ATP-binding protein [Clostridium sp.]|nr:ABC transporter ATP-binding protein [Clostridium sp.]